MYNVHPNILLESMPCICGNLYSRLRPLPKIINNQNRVKSLKLENVEEICKMPEWYVKTFSTIFEYEYDDDDNNNEDDARRQR